MIESLQALGEFLELLPDAAVVVEDGARIVLANTRTAEMAGHDPMDLPGMARSALLDGAVLLHRDGRRLLVDVSERALLLQGALEGRALVLATVRDTAARQRAEEELRTSEERLRQAVRVSAIGIFDHDHRTDFHYWSSRQYEMYGWPPGEPITVPTFLASLHPEDRQAIGDGIHKAHDPTGDGSFDVEHRIVRTDGEVRWIVTRSITQFEGDGEERRAVRTVGASLDLTERKLVEEGRAQLAAVLDATPDLVAVTDAIDRVLYLNRAARALFAIDDGADLTDVRLRHYRPQWAAKLVSETGLPAARRDGTWRGETAFFDRHGREIPFSQIVIRHQGPDGGVEYLSTIARDISKEKELEAQFLQAQKMEAIGRLAGGVAHDFNNLLSIILNAAALAKRNLPGDHPSLPDLDDITLAGDRAADLTRRMLTFSRKQVLRPQVVDVNDVLRGMAPMLRRLVREHIDQESRLDPELAPIHADPNHLEQAIMNLVVNACDAMPRGGRLTIETRNVQSSQVTLSVSDTGVGMDAATKARLFEPFFTTKPAGKGTGLGLSMVFGIVKQSGGDIGVQSEPGRGTTFQLFFPRANGVPRAAPPAAPEPASRANAEVVLLVEDEAQLRKLVAQVLRQSGYEVLVAEGPREALEMARERVGAINLLLTDVVMPNMSGPELAEQLCEARPQTRVLYMSGYAESGVADGGFLRPEVQLLAKPFTFEQLLAHVRDVLAQPRDAAS